MASPIGSLESSDGPPHLTVTGIWHDTAPQSLIDSYRSRNDQDGWNAWRRHLAKRRQPRDLEQLLDAETPPLTWALPDAAGGRDTTSILDRLEQVDAKESLARYGLDSAAHAWIAAGSPSHGDAARALECLAWCHTLPRLAKFLPARTWWDLFDHLVYTAEHAAGIDCEGDALAEELLCCELPLTLGYLFPELTQCAELLVHGRRELCEGLDNYLDDSGLPNGKHFEMLRPLLASWTRSMAIDRKLERQEGHGAKKQYRRLVRQALRFARRDGSQTLCQDTAGDWCPELFVAALALADDKTTRQLAHLTLPHDRRIKVKPAPKAKLPKPAAHSEWAELAILRTGWSRGARRLSVNYHGRDVAIELEVGREVVLSGTWGLDVRVGGELATPIGPWEQVGWETNKHVDYLEIEMQLSHGLRAQRQLVLAGEDGFLFAADVILGESPAEISCSSTLPVAPNISFAAEEETREGQLTGAKPRGLVLPLALPEWRVDRRPGSLAIGSHGLELRQATVGKALFAPLWIDLDRLRFTKPRTWRQLTVAEDHKISPRDVAVGYRVQVGNQQWLVYRSLAPVGNRTILSHNLVSEFLVSRFSRAGRVSNLIEIETDDGD